MVLNVVHEYFPYPGKRHVFCLYLEGNEVNGNVVCFL